MLVDSHCHLDFDDFSGDLDAVMERARDAGIEAFVTISIRVRDYSRLRTVAARHKDVWCAIGTHPHYADEETGVTTAELVAIARDRKVVAIGETGLDRFLGNASWQAQCTSFQRHIDAARQTRLPLVIHSVREDEAMAAILERESARGSFPVVMHCFSGGAALLRTNIALGHAISFSGLLTYPEQGGLRELARTVPDALLLVETDAPSLPPVLLGDTRNEPAHIMQVVRLLAELRGVGVEEIARVTTDNFYRIFTRCARDQARTGQIRR